MPRAALLVLALLVAGVAGFMWLSGTERTRAALADEAPESMAAADTPVELRAPVLATDDMAEVVERPRRTTMPDERARIAGRVRVAGGYTAALAARIEAEVYVGRENESRPRTVSTEVARDGSFELLVPKDTRYALLDVQGDLLYLADPVRTLPGESAAVLEPELLALIQGRVLPPLGETEVQWNDVAISCRPVEPEERPEPRLDEEGVPTSVRMLTEEEHSAPYTARPEDGGAYELVFMPTGVALELQVKNPFGPAWHQHVDPLLPGERREVVIALDRGITLAGRVLDEHGAPVAGTSVSVRAATGESRFRVSTSEDSCTTDSEGLFEVAGLARQTWELQAYQRELARGAELLVDGSAGDARDLVLSVVRGGCIEGAVMWPDGRPARSFSVAADSENGFRQDDFEDGRFELCGLTDDAHLLEVTAEGKGCQGKARLQGVRAGDRGLRIVLDSQQVFEVRGTVVDSQQRPVERFTTSAAGVRESHSESHSSGTFAVKGLTAGEWDIHVEAEGFLSANQHVLVGPSAPLLRFVLLAAGRIRGTVVDASGKPVAEAALHTTTEWIFGWDDCSTRTDQAGRFEVAATSSPVQLWASRQGHAPSEPAELSVASGDVVEGVVLRLREPCRLEGRVLDADGRPVGGAQVSMQSDRSYDGAQTGVHGEFAFEGLAPGRASVTASLQSFDTIVRGEATLVGGRTSVLELRLERSDPVRIRGRILRAGKPLACPLIFLSRNGQSFVTSGPDGRFEDTFARPGEWKCAVWLGDEGSVPRPQDVHVLDFVVPDVEQHELELDLDAMRPLESFEELGY